MHFASDAGVVRALPRHPDWAYEHHDGRAHLSYRPRPLELVRDLAPVAGRGSPGAASPLVVDGATGGETERHELVALVRSVWSEQDPFRTSGGAGSRFARTLDGRDDPWDPPVLVARAGGDTAVGLVALTAWRPGTDRRVPAEPALAWLTVLPGWRLAGVASALLAAAVEAARRSGAGELHSAVSGANLAGVRWHWVNGFRPVTRQPGSGPAARGAKT